VRIKYPIVIVDGVERQGIRIPYKATRVQKHVLTFDDVNFSKGNVFEMLARKYYGRDRDWQIIMENNGLKNPWEWKQGDVVMVPLREAGYSDNVVSRK